MDIYTFLKFRCAQNFHYKILANISSQSAKDMGSPFRILIVLWESGMGYPCLYWILLNWVNPKEIRNIKVKLKLLS